MPDSYGGILPAMAGGSSGMIPYLSSSRAWGEVDQPTNTSPLMAPFSGANPMELHQMLSSPGVQQQLAAYGLAYHPELLQQSPFFSNHFMQSHPTLAPRLSSAMSNLAMTPGPQGPEGAGSGIQRAMQGAAAGPSMQRQFQIGQMMAPMQAMGTLIPGQEAQMRQQFGKTIVGSLQNEMSIRNQELDRQEEALQARLQQIGDNEELAQEKSQVQQQLAQIQQEKAQSKQWQVDPFGHGFFRTDQGTGALQTQPYDPNAPQSSKPSATGAGAAKQFTPQQKAALEQQKQQEYMQLENQYRPYFLGPQALQGPARQQAQQMFDSAKQQIENKYTNQVRQYNPGYEGYTYPGQQGVVNPMMAPAQPQAQQQGNPDDEYNQYLNSLAGNQ